MTRLIAYLPFAAVITYMIVSKIFRFETILMRMTTLFTMAASVTAVYFLRLIGQASPIHKAMTGFLVLAGVAVWIWPSGMGQIFATYPTATLYAVLFLVAVGPPILGRDVFTIYFARKTTPAEVWQTDIFKKINFHLTGLWAVLFFCAMVSALMPRMVNLQRPFYEIVFEGLLPAALMLGIGVPANKRYPVYYQRKLGLVPVGNG